MIKYLCDCVHDCNNSDLPAVSFAECVDGMVSEESEISEIFISIESPVGTTKYKPADWSNKASWDAVISNSGAGVRRLNVIGNLEEPTSTTILYSGRRRKAGTKVFTLNAAIDDMSILNYDFGRRLQCGASVVIWYLTIGGYLYGGPDGFSVDVTKSGELLLSGENAFAVWNTQYQWESECSPPKIRSPWVSDGVGSGLTVFGNEFSTEFL